MSTPDARPDTTGLRDNAGPWTHDDGTACPTHYASKAFSTQGFPWWCTEHQQYVHAATTPESDAGAATRTDSNGERSSGGEPAAGDVGQGLTCTCPINRNNPSDYIACPTHDELTEVEVGTLGNPDSAYGPHVTAAVEQIKRSAREQGRAEGEAADAAALEGLALKFDSFAAITLSAEDRALYEAIARDLRDVIAERPKALDAVKASAKAEALREAADEMWRIFLRLPHTPSPLGDYIQRRVIELRARADRDTDGGPS